MNQECRPCGVAVEQASGHRRRALGLALSGGFLLLVALAGVPGMSAEAIEAAVANVVGRVRIELDTAPQQ